MKKRTPRPKLPGRIRQLASKDVFAAGLLARRGREFSEMEGRLALYYETLRRVDQIKEGWKPPEQKLLEDHATQQLADEYPLVMQHLLQKDASWFCDVFLGAINDRKPEIIFEIANAVKFLKTFRPEGDHYRADILLYKQLLEQKGEAWPIRILAKAIDWPLEDSENGFWKLRRMAKELKFPLERTTQITRK